jgi:hypothetical protein
LKMIEVSIYDPASIEKLMELIRNEYGKWHIKTG